MGVVTFALVVGVLFVVFVESAAEGERRAEEAATIANRRVLELKVQLEDVREERARERKEYAQMKRLWERDRRQWQIEKKQLLADRRKVISRFVSKPEEGD
jgi:hypothetical protein